MSVKRIRGGTATGVDIGSHGIRVVQISRRGESWSVERVAYRSVRELGRMEDSPAKFARYSSIIDNMFSQEKIRPRGVIASVPSQRALIKYVEVPPAPSWRLKMLIDYEVDAETQGKKDSAVSDFRLLDLPLTGATYTVMLGMVSSEVVDVQLGVLRGAGVKPVDLTFPAVGVYYTAAELARPSGGVDLVVSIGESSTDLVFVEKSRLYFIRTVPVGGKHFTDEVASVLGVDDWREAEEKKSRLAILPAESETPLSEEEKVSNALRKVALQLVGMIRSAVLFCRAQTKMVDLDVRRVLLTGGGAALRGLDVFLAEQLGMPVERLSFLDGLDLSRLPPQQRKLLEEDEQGFSAAVGLALSAFRGDLFFLSMLPEEVKRRRNFLERDVYVWIASVMLLLSASVVTVGAVKGLSGERDLFQREKALLEHARKQDDRIMRMAAENRLYAVRTYMLESMLARRVEVLSAMRTLRVSTPKEIRLLEMRMNIDRAGGGALPCGEKVWIYIRGLVKSPERATTGESVLKKYRDELLRSGLFERVLLLPGYAYGNDQIHFEMRLDLKGCGRG